MKAKKIIAVVLSIFVIASLLSARDKDSNFSVVECYDDMLFKQIENPDHQYQIIKQYIIFDKQSKKAWRFRAASGNEAVLDEFYNEVYEGKSEEVLGNILGAIEKGTTYLKRDNESDGMFCFCYWSYDKKLKYIKNGLKKFAFAGDATVALTDKDIPSEEFVSYVINPKPLNTVANFENKNETLKSLNRTSDSFEIRTAYVFAEGNRIIMTFVNGDTGNSQLVKDFVKKEKDKFKYKKGLYLGQECEIYSTTLIKN